jgi:MFS family permease
MKLKGNFAGLSLSTFLLAGTSLFGDVASEMLYPVLPLFLGTLGVSVSLIGVIEGVAPAIQNVTQGFSGWLSDRLQRHKAIALFGYSLSAIAKPLIGFATGWPGVLVARSLDRFGAGTRSAPRDALIAASADEAHRGKAFGLEGFGDNLGACLGPLVTLALVTYAGVQLHSIFFLTLVPGTIATLLTLFAKGERAEVTRPEKSTEKSTEKRGPSVERFPRVYWRYLAVTALFGLGNSTNAFLILRTQNLGVSLSTTILIYACFNLVAALASFPAGYLSDKWGRKRVLLAAFAIFVVVYVGFGLATNRILIGLLFALYGTFEGAFRAVGKAMATDFVPREARASGIGWYSTTVGLSGLVASVVGGQLWTHLDPAATFLYGAAFASVGVIALQFLIPG